MWQRLYVHIVMLSQFAVTFFTLAILHSRHETPWALAENSMCVNIALKLLHTKMLHVDAKTHADEKPFVCT